MSWAADNTGCVLFTVKPDNPYPSTTTEKCADSPRPVGQRLFLERGGVLGVCPPGGFKENDVIVNFGKIRRMVFASTATPSMS